MRITGMRLQRIDLLRGARRHQRDQMFTRRTLVVFVAVAAIMFVLPFATPPTDMPRAEIGLILAAVEVALLALLIGLTRYVAIPFAVRRRLREQTSLRDSVDVEWSPDRYRVSGPSIESDLPWDSYVRWQEDRHVFLFYISKRLYQICPKRWLSPDAIDEIRARLIGAGVKRTVRFLG